MVLPFARITASIRCGIECSKIQTFSQEILSHYSWQKSGSFWNLVGFHWSTFYFIYYHNCSIILKSGLYRGQPSKSWISSPSKKYFCCTWCVILKSNLHICNLAWKIFNNHLEKQDSIFMTACSGNYYSNVFTSETINTFIYYYTIPFSDFIHRYIFSLY